MCLHSYRHYCVEVRFLGSLTEKPAMLSLPPLSGLRTHPYSRRHASPPLLRKHHWHSKQTLAPKLGFGHLFCPSLENAIKPAWQSCQHKGQRGLHSKKLCHFPSSKGCIKTIWAPKNSSSQQSVAISDSFSCPSLAVLMSLCQFSLVQVNHSKDLW